MTAPKKKARGVRTATAESAPKIDRAKLRDALRTIGDESVFYMLDEAIDLLPPDTLAKLVGQYIQLERLRPDAGADATKRSLLEDVKAFDAASRAKKYYVSFNVNSKNYTETSTGTRAFIAECRRQLDRCVAQASKGAEAETRDAFDVIFALLRDIDEGSDDIVFFADEGGSWLVGVDWRKVFPAWFRCLSRSAEPADFANAVVTTVDAFEEHSRGAYFAAARKIATASQGKALAARGDKQGATPVTARVDARLVSPSIEFVDAFLVDDKRDGAARSIPVSRSLSSRTTTGPRRGPRASARPGNVATEMLVDIGTGVWLRPDRSADRAVAAHSR